MSSFSSILGPAGGFAGGLLGFFGAGSSNRAVIANAVAQQEAANENIQNLRFSFFDRSRSASDQFARQQGQTSAALFAGARSGTSLNSLLASSATDFVRDDFSRKKALADNIRNLEIQKENIRRQAQSQLQSPFFATAQGAASGFSLGQSIGGALDSAVSSVKDSNFVKDLRNSPGFEGSSLAGPPSPFALAQQSALASGVSPSILRQFPQLSAAPFLTQQRLQLFNINSLLQQQQLLNQDFSRGLGRFNFLRGGIGGGFLQ